MPCGWGAYNFSTAFFLGDAEGGRLRPVNLRRTSPRDDGRPSHHAVNAAYHPRTGLLQAFNKSRGVGDCGAEEVWAWDGRGFILARERVMGRCGGVLVDLWPVLHRAEVR